MFLGNFQAAVGKFLADHVAPFFDKTALMLWAVSLGLLLLIDPVMVKTLVQWTLFFLTLAGIVVVISRLAFPMINLRNFVQEAYRGNGNTAAGLVVLAIALFMGLTLLSLVLWAKA